MKVAVIGHTGMGGSALTQQLLSRGHEVTGLALDAEKVPSGNGLASVKADIFDVPDLTEKLKGHDVVVSIFSGGHEVDLKVYYRQAEGTRRIIKAFRDAKGKYLMYVGGAASLFVKPGLQMFDDPRFPRWYFGVQPAVHLRWLGDITGEGFFYDAAARKESGEIQPGQSDSVLEECVKNWKQVPLLEGCRIALDLFEGRNDFSWSFLSPPWLYRPGTGSGRYELSVDYMIFEKGVPTGIAVPDLALALADEVENQALIHKHWTLYGEQVD
ncbi:NAD(P)H-binding protein [uncultured Cohaesibacter sp.]|uniref:NAD(P)-dependent oxidoreductase n=1 Tax=uncultured Cohaesibacter sp. TaxID=1002546 RepID=UPI0029C61946|nr:NAD(P)H-binding protein [uncultured Cohaesibacter sp.]